jgi:hypothetical protein
MCFGTIFSCTHILPHHFNFHCSTSWIKQFFPIFFGRLRIRPRPWTFIWLFEANTLMHAESIFNWFLWDGFQTPLRFFSPKRFREWIPTLVSTLFSYHTRSHSMLNCTYLWGDLLLSHDQTFGWGSSHCCKGSVVLFHKLLLNT